MFTLLICAVVLITLAASVAFAAPESGALIGDSLVTKPGLGHFYPRWYNSSRKGAPSSEIVKKAWAYGANCIVSAGSNDIPPTHLEANLNKVLDRTRCIRIVLVRPAHANQGDIVDRVANERGIPSVGFTPGPDGVHPASYAALNNNVVAALHAEGARELPVYVPAKWTPKKHVALHHHAIHHKAKHLKTHA